MKTSNGYFVMNSVGWFFTHSALALGFPSCFGFCGFPSAPTGVSAPSSPSGMIFFYDIVRLPLCHTIIITKEFITMKIRCGAIDWLSAIITFLNNTVRPTWIRFSNLPRLSTFKRTIHLIPFPRACAWLPTDRAYWGRKFLTPSVFQITRSSTKVLVRSSIVRIKIVATLFALFNFINIFHELIINYIVIFVKIEEKYCQIAIKRLSQGVLPL